MQRLDAAALDPLFRTARTYGAWLPTPVATETLHALYARSWFAGQPAAIESTAFRNSSLQGGCFILAARALGLDFDDACRVG